MDKEPVMDYLRNRLLPSGAPMPGDNDPLFSNGLIDSFGVLELIAFLEEEYGINIDTAKHHIFDFDTLCKVAKVVEEEIGRKPRD